MAAMHNYGKPKILETFKNTLPSYSYRAFPTENLRQPVEIEKRILTKEKLR